ncbi:hypothetical protein QFC22_002074 [Naganishia vaughanmartiniae]|uniref:Uncharacterized protein n=1 Tax=Naganishia vaughanmartiniae TaxID=1424756 RepID=A0ACC2XCU0_9TREE|nr:hypothetical protein QFC22_002074 [Naganishia vaughanmartiniae]
MFDPFSELKSSYQAVRKNSAANDVYNRLHSIAKDTEFVRRVSQEWYNDQLVVIPNQRCGVWYCDPSWSASEYAYFKSTDGHMGQWDFSLRRANLHLIDFANKNGGFIIVDSTRRGKRMPDALSKTIPVWCAVINRAIAKRRCSNATHPQQEEWDSALYCPPNIVSPTEKSQIEAKIDGWADQLLNHPAVSSNDASTSPPPPFIPIVCLSASTFIEHGGPEPMRSRTGLGFEYIQGSGDDEDLWAHGLKPRVFQQNQELLLSTLQHDFAGVVDQLKTTVEDTATPLNSANLATLTEVPVGSGLFLGVANSSPQPGSLTIQLTRKTQDEFPDLATSAMRRFFRIPRSKKGEIQFVTSVLPACAEAAINAFNSTAPRICVVDDDGKDTSVGTTTGAYGMGPLQ